MRLTPCALLVLAVVMHARELHAGAPHAIESRGSPGVRSGPEAGRFEYAGDNDSFGFLIAPNGLPYDRWVSASNQLRLRLAWQDPWPGVARAFAGLALSQNIYTPRTAEVASRAQLAGDRPYAGWLGLTLSGELVLPSAPLARAFGADGVTHVGVDVSAGALGPWSLAGDVQYYSHWSYLRLEGKPLPPRVGWGVIEQAPALAADVLVFAETSVWSAQLDPPWWMALVGGAPGLELAVGATAHGGTWIGTGGGSVVARGGWWGDARAPASALVPIAAYLFARTELRAVARNAAIDAPLLDGQPAARAAPVVAEGAVGAVLRVWMLEGTFATVVRSNEVESMPRAFRSGQVIWRLGVAILW